MEMIQIFNDLNRVYDTKMSRTEPLKVFQGSVDHLFFMVGKGMTVDTFQSAVTAVAQPLHDVLVWNPCCMEGGCHVMAVVVKAGMRKAMLTEEPIVPGRESIWVEVADVTLFADKVDDVIRELYITITFVGFRHLFDNPCVLIIYHHVCMNMHYVCMKVLWPFQSTDFTPSQSANGG